MAKYRDFDAFFKEQKREPVILRYQGETHHLPPSLPVLVTLRLKAMANEGSDKEVSDEAVISLFKALFGLDRYSKWVQGGMTIEEMVALLGWAMESYGLAVFPAEGDAPNSTPTPEK